ncbi:reticulocalbin-1-like [Lytechinus pictus]|uniref:reticulocalbin-1-like n=1 Tax=Lytechinus pictus TaxID=7653 RepID=UPI0030BA29DA
MSHLLIILGVMLSIGVNVIHTKNAVNEKEEANKIEDILPHYADDRHLDSFDQTLFLGGQAKAKIFRSLSDEKRKEVFSDVFKLVDKNGDEHISKDELTEWLYHALLTVDKEDAINSMDPIDDNKDKMVSWFEYHDYVFGYAMGDDVEENREAYTKHIKRSKRAFDLADSDGDGFLTPNEFHMFHNPRLFKQMEKVVIMDSLEDFDTNKDGGIEVNEFIGDFLLKEEEEDLPDWVLEERRVFETEHDLDGNGKLEGTEIFELESQEKSLQEQAEREVDHLMIMADTDKDDLISLEEALQSEALFMGNDHHFHKNPNIVIQHNEL